MSVFSICCNTGTGTAVKTVPGGALDNHFEASGTASGYEIEVAGYTYTIHYSVYPAILEFVKRV